MQPKFVCSKCGESGFVTINDLERHIVKQHFSSVYALYKCCFTKCQVRFATEVDRLKHMDCKQHGRKYASLRALMPMQDEEFVSLRLAINDCLNESIKLSFSRLTESNGNNDQDPPSIESSAMRLIGLASTAHQRPAPTQQNFSGTNKKKRQNPQTIAATHPDQSTEAVVESLARRTDANASISKPRKTRLDNFGLNDESNNRTELDKSLLVPAYPLSNDDSIDKSNERTQPDTASTLSFVNSVLVKDEPNLMEELITAFPSSSNYNDSLIPSDTESAAPSLKPKRSRKQNFFENAENIKSTLPQTSSNPPVIKEEPSLIDELAESIPGPSNNRISPSNNVISMDSDDEIMIVTTPKRPRAQNSGSKVGTKNLTAPQKLAIVRANEQGTKKGDIAKIFDTSINTVYRVLDEYKCQGTVKRKFRRGRKKKITPEIEQFIVDSCKNDVLHSVNETVIAVKKTFGVEICRQTVTSVRYNNGLFGRRLKY
ncbi:hypothetical protein DdX_18520 [Ditylenchus destructor]|uniref:C2H2-type domain-containing protein n=1 Tax=Ditylenchus destructor TaxID=166010 RepID=A0AAD4MKK3_9BILA|nr:hypothetical protein DdX_18520 [Ditylenchus destructor]